MQSISVTRSMARALFNGSLLCCMLVGVALYPALADAATSDCSKIAHELAERVHVDQALRDEFAKASTRSDFSPTVGAGKDIIERMAKVDSDNRARLATILQDCGWPTDAGSSHDAWLLTQHADDDLALQKMALPLLKQAVDSGHAAAKDFAYLTDRIAVAEGKPQLYGTQFIMSDPCTLILKPIDDFRLVVARRKALGMETMEDYVARGRRNLLDNGCAIVTVENAR